MHPLLLLPQNPRLGGLLIPRQSLGRERPNIDRQCGAASAVRSAAVNPDPNLWSWNRLAAHTPKHWRLALSFLSISVYIFLRLFIGCLTQAFLRSIEGIQHGKPFNANLHLKIDTCPENSLILRPTPGGHAPERGSEVVRVHSQELVSRMHPRVTLTFKSEVGGKCFWQPPCSFIFHPGAVEFQHGESGIFAGGKGGNRGWFFFVCRNLFLRNKKSLHSIST